MSIIHFIIEVILKINKYPVVHGLDRPCQWSVYDRLLNSCVATSVLLEYLLCDCQFHAHQVTKLQVTWPNDDGVGIQLHLKRPVMAHHRFHLLVLKIFKVVYLFLITYLTIGN